MIEIIFYYGSEVILVRVNGNKIEFGNSAYGNKLATIEGINLDKNGVVKEFPDLKDRNDWRSEAIRRFKEHISKFNSEDEKADYIIRELSTKGYIPKYKQKAGFRPINLK